MSDEGRVITAKLDGELVDRLDEAAERIERSKSWIVRAALEEWLAEENLRHRLTVEALSDVDQGRLVDQFEIDDWANSLTARKSKKARRTA